jgi:selenocysteine-specific elongation factor
LHLGTAEILARVVLIGAAELAPGASTFAQLRLETPTLALPGDHFIIRSYSPSVTIGGGIVLDPMPQKHRARETVLKIETLELLAAADETGRIGTFVALAGEHGISDAELAARSGSSNETIARAGEDMTRQRRGVIIPGSPPRFLAKAFFDDLLKKVRTLIREYHQKAPLDSGMAREEVRERLFARLNPEIFRAVISHAISRGEIVAEKDLLRLSTHRIELSPQEQAAKNHLADVYARAALRPISLDEAITQAGPQLGIDSQRAQRFAQMLINSGVLVRIADLIFHQSAIEELKSALRRFKIEHSPRIDVSAFKELTGVSRKYAIPLLEYLDRQRITRRVGDAREIL